MWKPFFIRDLLQKRSMKRFYYPALKKGTLCFDIGANKGERTLCYLELGAKVVALEPQKKCFDLIEQKHGNHKNLVVLNFAVGEKEEIAPLNLCDESDECASLSPKFIKTYTAISGFHWPNSEFVNVVTLDSLIQTYGKPDFCKIDVEGFETEVIRGLSHPIREIHFEFNLPLLDDAIECLTHLEKLGEYKCNYLIYERMKPILKDWIAIKEFRENLFSIIPSNIETGEILVRL